MVVVRTHQRVIWRALSFFIVFSLLTPNLMGLSLLTAAPALAAGTIRGTVYRDFNLNATRETTEPGVAGVTVTVFDAAGAPRGTASTGADGLYNIAATGTGPYRVEFTTIPAPFEPGPHGSQNGTTIQFVPEGGAANVDLGVNDPAEYCQNLPFLSTSCFVNGNPLGGGNVGTRTSLVSVRYDATDVDPAAQRSVTLARETGTIWGLGYQRSSNILFAAAMAKRHSGFGPLGTGGIYAIRINPLTGERVSVAPWVDLNTLNIPTGADPHTGLPAQANLPSNDPATFDAVGKIAIGDLEISEDEQTMFVMNLNNRTVYVLPIGLPATVPAASAIRALPITLPSGARACAANDLRPWALEAHRGLLFVGVVCSAQSSQNTADLTAYVLRTNPNAAAPAFELALQFPLNYERGCVSRVGGSCYNAEWRPWTAQMRTLCTDQNADGTCDLAFGKQIIYPQPILASIDFDTDGAMVVGLMDRTGNQTGFENYSPTPAGPIVISQDGSTLPTFTPNQLFDGATAGDLLRVCRTATGYVLESNATCPGLPPTAGTNQNPVQGPGGGEWFWQDMHPVLLSNINASLHDETSLGTAVIIAPRNEVVTGLYNPLGDINSGGLGWFNANTGARPRSYEVFDASTIGSFGKAGGLGDLEALCLPAPIEIGNYIWLDRDRDGVQDPGETPFANITVRLYTAGPNGQFGDADDVLAGTTTTDAQGRYYFTNLAPLTNYQVRVDTAQSDLIGYLLTEANTDSSPNGDSRDSDALPVGLDAVITLRTGRPGQNNHTYDIGFIEAPTSVDVENYRIVSVNNGTVTLGWDVLPASGLLGFELQRADSDAFVNPVTVYSTRDVDPAGGAFTAVDTPPGAGPWWYRLIAVDATGSQSLVGVVSTALNGQGPTRQLFLPAILRR